MIVTNGTRIDDAWLAEVDGALDWVTLSVDSPRAATHVELGRAVGGVALLPTAYEAMADAVRRRGLRLKVNTVVSALNVHEDFSAHIRRLRPERWKVFQVLPVGGQNDGSVEPLLLPAGAFAGFVARHAHLAADGIVVVPEDNDAMTGTYAMVGPNGCFYDNVTGRHRYSRPILAAGLDAAWADVGFDPEGFDARGGLYAW